MRPAGVAAYHNTTHTHQVSMTDRQGDTTRELERSESQINALLLLLVRCQVHVSHLLVDWSAALRWLMDKTNMHRGNQKGKVTTASALCLWP